MNAGQYFEFRYNVVNQRLSKVARNCASKISEAFGNPLNTPLLTIFKLEHLQLTNKYRLLKKMCL